MRTFSPNHFKTPITIVRNARTRTDSVAGVLVDLISTATILACVSMVGDAVRVMIDDRIEYHQEYRLAFQSNPNVGEGDYLTWVVGTGLCRGPAAVSGSNGVNWFVTIDVIK